MVYFKSVPIQVFLLNFHLKKHLYDLKISKTKNDVSIGICLLCTCTGGIDSILVVTGIYVIFLLHLYKKISKQITIIYIASTYTK